MVALSQQVWKQFDLLPKFDSYFKHNSMLVPWAWGVVGAVSEVAGPSQGFLSRVPLKMPVLWQWPPGC